MKLVFGLYLFAAVLCFADTPPPGALYVKGGTDGTKIGNTGDSLKVTVTGGGGTVNQGTGGLSPWLVNINNASLPVTQSGSWSVTASQGAPPWSFNLSQYLGSSVSVTNPIASRISNGTSFVDPTQIRALTSSDQVTTIQGTSPWIINGTVTANAGTGTFQTNILNASIPVTQSGTWTNTVTQTTAANLNATVVTTAGATIAKDSSLTTINSTLGSPFQAGGSIGNTTFGATQSGSWTTGRTWNLSSGSDSVAITGSVTASNASIGANGSSAPASSTQVGGSDGTNLQPLQVDGSKNLKVVVQNTVPVTGTFFQATQPVSIAAPVAVTGTFFQATQPVSGTVTANAGSGTFLVDGSAHTQPVSGTFFQATQPVSAAALPLPANAAQETGGHLASIDTKLTSPLTVNATLQTGSNVIGSISNTSFTATQATGTNLHTVVDSGSITANAGTNLNTSALALSATQTNGSQKTQVVDGAGTVVGPVQTISGTNYQPVVLAASATSGSALVARSIQVAGSDGVNARTILTDTSGNQQIVGNVASAASDSGNPVKVGGVYNSTQPTFTNGQRGDLQLSSNGELVITTLDSTYSNINITTQDLATTSTTGANGQIIYTGTPTASSTASFTLASDGGATVQVSGTWTGTLQIEVSMDGGTTWFARPIHQTGTAFTLPSFTANFTGGFSVAGYTTARVRAISAITGTAIIELRATDNENTVYIGGFINVSGHSPNATFTQNYGSTAVTTAAFTTVITSTTSAIQEEDIFDTSGGDYFLSYAATCGALSSATNTIIISAGGGGKDLLIPAGFCVGIKAKTANLSAGSVNMTFYQ